MSITKSYNRKTDTYYAYDTVYEWDEILQKRVQRKHCIGKFDPKTGEIVPNGPVGRPAGVSHRKKDVIQGADIDRPELDADIEDLATRCQKVEKALADLTSEIQDLNGAIQRISSKKGADS